MVYEFVKGFSTESTFSDDVGNETLELELIFKEKDKRKEKSKLCVYSIQLVDCINY